MKYPYLAYKLVGALCSNAEVNFVNEKRLLKNGHGITIHWNEEPYDESGKITEKCRTAIREIARQQSKKTTLRICAVYGPNDCDYVEPDGSFGPSGQPPSFTMQLADGEHKAEFTHRSGKINVGFTRIENSDDDGEKEGESRTPKINYLLGFVLLFSSLLFGCTTNDINSRLPRTSCFDFEKSTTVARNDLTDREITLVATARCRDGSLSDSHSRRGTCSHHGGVMEWLR